MKNHTLRYLLLLSLCAISGISHTSGTHYHPSDSFSIRNSADSALHYFANDLHTIMVERLETLDSVSVHRQRAAAEAKKWHAEHPGQTRLTNYFFPVVSPMVIYTSLRYTTIHKDSVAKFSLPEPSYVGMYYFKKEHPKWIALYGTKAASGLLFMAEQYSRKQMLTTRTAVTDSDMIQLSPEARQHIQHVELAAVSYLKKTKVAYDGDIKVQFVYDLHEKLLEEPLTLREIQSVECYFPKPKKYRSSNYTCIIQVSNRIPTHIINVFE